MSKIKTCTLALSFAVSISTVLTTQASPNFTNESGAVTDSVSGLQWQDSYPNNGDEVKSGSFEEATKYCSELRLLDKQDWRMPTRDELISIVDETRTANEEPMIQKAFTKVLTEEGYLSSTNYEDDDETVWILDYTHGESTDVALTNIDGYHIRCVRSN